MSLPDNIRDSLIWMKGLAEFRRAPGRQSRRRGDRHVPLAEQLEKRILLAVAGPTLDAISDVVIGEDTAQYTVALTGISSGGNALDPVRISAQFQSNELNCSLRSIEPPQGASGSLILEPTHNSFGVGQVSVTVENGGADGDLSTAADNLSVVRTFSLTINPMSFQTNGDTLELELDKDGDTVSISTDQDVMQFHLPNNVWHGEDNEYVSGNGTSVLRVSAAGRSFLKTIRISDTAVNTQIVFSGSTDQYFAQSVFLQQTQAPRPLVINSPLRMTANAGFEAQSSGAIIVNSTGLIESTDGAVILTSDPFIGPAHPWGSGVNIAGGSVRSIGTGSIAIRGPGTSTEGASPDGVVICAGGKVRGGTTGNVVIVGSGGEGTTLPARGVVVSGAGSEILASGAGLSITGTGGNSDTTEFNSGIQVDGGGSIKTIGTASLWLNGFGGVSGGNYNRGVHVSGAMSRVETEDGFLSVRGTGGGRSDAAHNVGVLCDAGGQISVLGAGNLQVVGEGGFAAGGFNRGVAATGSMSGFYVHSGNLALEGTGGGIGNSASNSGVFLDAGSRVQLDGSGTLTVNGLGGKTDGDQNRGVLITGDSTVVSSSGAEIQIDGTGGGTGTSSWNYGVSVEAGATLQGVVESLITISGTGGVSAGLNNRGVVLTGQTTHVLGDQILISGIAGGTEAGTAGPVAILLESGANLQADHGDIAFKADSLEIAADSSVNAGVDGNVSIAQSSNGRTIVVGSLTRSDTSLDLSQVTLSSITTHTLAIGNETSGTISIVSDLNLKSPTNLILKSANEIVVEEGNVNTGGGQLVLHPGSGSSGTNSDQVSLGSISSDETAVSVLVVDANLLNTDAATAAFAVTGRLVLNDSILQLNHAADLEPGKPWLLIQNDGTDAIVGNFKNADASGRIVFDDITFRVSMTGGDGNDVTLTREDPGAVGEIWGTLSHDVFVIEPSGISGSGTFEISRSLDGAAPVHVASISREFPLSLHGIAGTDEVVIRGTSSNDSFVVKSSTVLLNGSPITISGIEKICLTGQNGSDSYQFYADHSLGVVRIDDVSGDADTIDFSKTILNSVKLSLAVTVAQSVNSNLSLQLTSASGIERLIGGSRADTLSGNNNANTILGSGGGDTLSGGLGSDILIGGPGDDTYVFTAANGTDEVDTLSEGLNAGIDTLDFSALTTGVVVNLGSTASQPVHLNRRIRLSNGLQFERVKGGSGNDVLAGNSVNNLLQGNSGDDRISGGGGDDLLIGGTGNDTYVFRASTAAELDTLSDGVNAGIDTLDFSALTTSVVVNLGSTASQPVHLNRRIRLNNGLQFERVKGGSGNDILAGNSINNLLQGNSGDDRLSGGSGDDILIGGAGNDELFGGNHQDLLIPGRVSYESNSAVLMKLVLQWTANLELAQKINTFRQPGDVANVLLLPKITVFDDGLSSNRLAGEDGIDWFFSSIGDLLFDFENGEYLDVVPV